MDVVGERPGAAVQSADHHQLPPDGGQPAGEREAMGAAGGRWQRGPGTGGRLEERETENWGGKRGLLLGRDGLGLDEGDNGPGEAGGPSEAVEAGGLEVVHPVLADGPDGGEGVEGDADEALASDLLRQPRKQLVFHDAAKSLINGDDEVALTMKRQQGSFPVKSRRVGIWRRNSSAVCL